MEEKQSTPFATSTPVDIVCGFKHGNMNGVEAFVERYRVRWSIKTGYRCIIHEAQNYQQGRVRTHAITVHVHPFVQHADINIIHAPKS